MLRKLFTKLGLVTTSEIDKALGKAGFVSDAIVIDTCLENLEKKVEKLEKKVEKLEKDSLRFEYMFVHTDDRFEELDRHVSEAGHEYAKEVEKDLNSLQCEVEREFSELQGAVETLDKRQRVIDGQLSIQRKYASEMVQAMNAQMREMATR